MPENVTDCIRRHIHQCDTHFDACLLQHCSFWLWQCCFLSTLSSMASLEPLQPVLVSLPLACHKEPACQIGQTTMRYDCGLWYSSHEAYKGSHSFAYTSVSNRSILVTLISPTVCMEAKDLDIYCLAETFIIVRTSCNSPPSC